jgi:drug/metabolite transporter (DMT)-like permease
MSRRGWSLFVAMCLIWGVPYLLIKVAVGAVAPVVLVFFRTVTGAALLLPFAARRRDLAELARHWRILLVYTGVEVGVPWLLLSDAERTLSSSLSGLLVATVPLIGVVLSALAGGRERFGGRRLLGLFLGLGGVALVLGFDVGGANLHAVGELALVALGYAIGPMLISRRLGGLRPIGVVCASLSLCALAYAPLALTHLPATPPSAGVILAIAALAVFCTALAFILFFALIAEAGPVRATVITYVNPAVAVALGVLVLGEPLTASIGAGFALILLGSVLATARPASAAAPARRSGGDVPARYSPQRQPGPDG